MKKPHGHCLVPWSVLFPGYLRWRMPMLIYGSNTLFFFIYTWPFFLALMPVAVVVGIALHSLMDGKLRYSIVFTLMTVGIMFGALFMWLLG